MKNLSLAEMMNLDSVFDSPDESPVDKIINDSLEGDLEEDVHEYDTTLDSNVEPVDITEPTNVIPITSSIPDITPAKDKYEGVESPLKAIKTLMKSAKDVDVDLVDLISGYCTVMASCSEMKNAAMIKEYRTAHDQAVKVITDRKNKQVQLDESDLILQELQRLGNKDNDEA